MLTTYWGWFWEAGGNYFTWRRNRRSRRKEAGSGKEEEEDEKFTMKVKGQDGRKREQHALSTEKKKEWTRGRKQKNDFPGHEFLSVPT